MIVRHILHLDEVDKILDSCERCDREQADEQADAIDNEDAGEETMVKTEKKISINFGCFRAVFFSASISLIYILPLLLPLHPVDDGASANWVMMCFTMPLNSILGLAPFVETFQYIVFQDSCISVQLQGGAILCGATVISVLHVIFAEGSVGINLFPFPFAPFLLGIVGLAVTCRYLFYFIVLKREKDEDEEVDHHTHDTKDLDERLLLSAKVLCVFIFTVIFALLWAVILTYLRVSPKWQIVWSLFYGPTKFLCKHVIFAPVLTHASPRRWLIVTMVTEIFFVRFQTVIFPFITSYWSLAAILLESLVLPAWKFYGGPDRSRMIFSLLQYPCKAPNKHGRMIRSSFDRSSGKLPPKFNIYTFWSNLFRQALFCFYIGIVRASIKEIFTTDMSTNCMYENDIEILSDVFDDDCHWSVAERTEMTEAGQSRLSQEVLLDNNEVQLLTSKINKGEQKTQENFPFDHEPIDGPNEQSVNVFSPSARLRSVFSSINVIINKCSLFTRNEALKEYRWEQRYLFWVVDVVGAEAISLIVRLQHMLSSLVVYCFLENHMNRSFYNPKEFERGMIMGVVAFVFELFAIYFYFSVVPKVVKVDFDRNLQTETIASYIFEGNERFLILWLAATGMFVTSTMINHFGADFTMQFEWLRCRVSAFHSKIKSMSRGMFLT